jgi:Asp-tRNA(Asn)/Glu-tRNA(Gln) amidotransferase A subunit family amidase
VGVRNPPTRNPWNLAHTAGGTSSGSGAAVGARMVPFALGEQTMGSNLRPAAYCGVDGLKPTFGRVSRFGCYPFSWSQDHVGLIGLDMHDLALVLSVMAGPDPRDPAAYSDPPPPAELRMAGFRPPRIGVVRNFYPERTEADMQDAIEKSASKLRDAGATVGDYRLPEEFGLTWIALRLREAESTVFHAARRAHNPTPGLAGHAAGELIPATYYLHARRLRTWLQDKVIASMADLDAILMPVAPGAAPEGLESTGDPSLLAPWSWLGFPAITVNGGVNAGGLPLGLQFVATPRRDHELLHAGAWVEGVLGRLPAPSLA